MYYLHPLYRRAHSKWCLERYVRQSLPQTTNSDRSLAGASRMIRWMACAFSQLLWNGQPQTPPTFSRSTRGCMQSALNGFEYVSFRVVHIGFFSKDFRDSAHAFRYALRPNALRTSCSVQPPSCNICKPKYWAIKWLDDVSASKLYQVLYLVLGLSSIVLDVYAHKCNHYLHKLVPFQAMDLVSPQSLDILMGHIPDGKSFGYLYKRKGIKKEWKEIRTD